MQPSSDTIYQGRLTGKASCYGLAYPCTCHGQAPYWEISKLETPVELTNVYDAQQLSDFAKQINIQLKQWRISLCCGVSVATCLIPGICILLCYQQKAVSAVKKIVDEENKIIKPLGLEWLWMDVRDEWDCAYAYPATPLPCITLKITSQRIQYEALHPEARKLTKEMEARSTAHAGIVVQVASAPPPAYEQMSSV